MDGRGGGSAAALRTPRLRAYCRWCGGEVYAGGRAYAGCGGLVHPECLWELLREKPGEDFLAEICGFEEVIA